MTDYMNPLNERAKELGLLDVFTVVDFDFMVNYPKWHQGQDSFLPKLITHVADLDTGEGQVFACTRVVTLRLLGHEYTLCFREHDYMTRTVNYRSDASLEIYEGQKSLLKVCLRREHKDSQVIWIPCEIVLLREGEWIDDFKALARQREGV